MAQVPHSSDIRVLTALLHADRAISVHSLSQFTLLSVAATSEAIERLSQSGCRFHRHPHQGMQLVNTDLSCWADYIEAHHAEALGRRTLIYRHTTSTQDVARRLIDGGENPSDLHGSIIVADHQTAGRGRLGRRWDSQAGHQLLMTAIIADPHATTDRLMLSAATAVALTAEKLLKRPVELRWPNDVYVNGAKLAGILIETKVNVAMIGIGINVLAPMDDPIAEYARTCLHAHGCSADRLRVLDVLLTELADALNSTDVMLAQRWRERVGHLHQRVTVICDGRPLTGRILDIDPSHGLLFGVEDGSVTLLPAASTSLTAAGRI